MKKLPANASPTADRAPTKKLSRAPKKTILTIAPNEPYREDSTLCDIDNAIDIDSAIGIDSAIENNHVSRLAEPVPSISAELATSLSCDLMAVALQLRCWLPANEKMESAHVSVLGLIDEFDKALGIATTGNGALPRLQSLLFQLHRDELAIGNSVAEMAPGAKQVLAKAIHAVISALSQNVLFEQAVESASQRAIYQFAYGLTHEINNPLANIAARAQQMISTATSDSDRRSLATIVDQSMRAHEMLAEMMRVVQPRSLRTRLENIVAIVEHAAATLEQQWAHAKIQCSQRMSSTPLYCSADHAALTEILCSILQNSLQVCRPNDRVEIVCEEVEPSDPEYGPADASPQIFGSRIRIAIRDTGPGMSCDVADRAWDLYFSGREHGRGLGISLANVRQTIDAHGGLVWIQSKPNAGCTVEIRLPKSPEPNRPRKAFSI